MLSNLAGNGFVAAHYIPWTLALLSTYGKFMRDPNAQVASPEDMGGDTEAGSSEEWSFSD